MNCSAYLFTATSGQHEQYPNDSAAPLFQRLASLATEPEQLVIHREGELIFYAYIRLLEPASREYFGFSLVINGEQIIGQFEQLMEFYDLQIRHLALEKTLLTLDDYGHLRRTEQSFSSQFVLLDRAVQNLRRQALALRIPLRLLPPPDYSVDSHSHCVLPLAEDDQVILAAIARSGAVSLMRNEGYQDPSLRQYSEQLCRLATERDTAREELLALQKQYHGLLRQKKQYKKVTVLSLFVAILVLVGLVGFSVLGYNLRLVQQDAQEQVSKNESLTEQNEKLERNNQDLAHSYQKERQEHQEARSLLNDLAGDMPIVITGLGVATTGGTSESPTDFSQRAGVDRCLWIAIKYKELEEAAIDLRCEVYRAEDNYLVTSTEIPLQTLLLGEGVRTAVSPALEAEWSEGAYRIEVSSGDSQLYSRVFHLY